MEIGNTFEGYRLQSYDREQRTLLLKSPDTQLNLSLRASAVKAEQIVLKGKLTVKGAGRAIEVSVAVLVLGRESSFPLGHNCWLRFTVSRYTPHGATLESALNHTPKGRPVDPGSLIYELEFEEQDEEGILTLQTTPKMIVPPGHGFETRGGFEFFYEP